MIMAFEYYVKKNLVKRTTPNSSIAKSLTKKAETRLNLISEKEIKDETASILFEEIYEALREAAQSLMQIKGFKPYSHEALISFLFKEKLINESFTKKLNSYRILRNKSVYEAHKVSTETCKEALEFAKEEIPRLIEKLGRSKHTL